MHIQKQLYLHLTLICLALVSFTSIASAQYVPNRKDTNPTREQIEAYGFTGILPLDKTGFTVFQRYDTPQDQLIFFVASRTPLLGCFTTIPYELSQKTEGKTLVVMLEFPIVQIDKSPGCKKTRSMETAEMMIDLDMLRDKEIDTLRLQSKYATREFKMELDNRKISLKPKTSILSDGIEYWFLPTNAVMLSVPAAKSDIYFQKAMLQELAEVAKENGLTPIEEKIPDFMPNELKYNKFYFLDNEGTVVDMLKNGQKNLRIGEIHRHENFYGPNGQFKKKIPLDIIATLPADMD